MNNETITLEEFESMTAKEFASKCSSLGEIYCFGPKEGFELDSKGAMTDKALADSAYARVTSCRKFDEGLSEMSNEEITKNVGNIMRILSNRIFFLEMDNAIELAYIRDNQNVQRGVTPFDIKPGEKYASLN